MGAGTALYTGVSGLDAMSKELSVIGNNISNSSTVGFKGNTSAFANLLSTSLGGSSGIDAGSGVQMEAIQTDFSQGTLQSTSNPLDMAIQGSGFFTVKAPSGSLYYTRAGQFSVDKNGNIVTPHGEFLQGAAAVTQPIITTTGTTAGTFGAVGNINISTVATSQPSMTGTATIYTNLQSTATNFDPTGPLATAPKTIVISNSNNLINISTNSGTTYPTTVTIAPGSYSGVQLASLVQAAITPSDAAFTCTYGAVGSNGLTFPYAPTTDYTFCLGGSATTRINWAINNSMANTLGFSSTNPGNNGLVNGKAVTNPNVVNTRSDFQTVGFDPTNPGNAFSTVMSVYDSAGNSHLVNIYFEKVKDGTNATNPNLLNASTPLTPGNTWMYWAVVPASDSASGYATIGAQGILEFNQKGALVDVTPNPAQDGTSVGLNSFDFAGGVVQKQQIKFDFGQIALQETINQAGSGTTGATQYGSASGVTNQFQDGYAAGSLNNYSVDQTGVLSGTFTNGQTRNIAQLELARFNAPTQLTNSGNNLWSQSANSGQPIPGLAGTAGFGKIFSSSLEESNVDISSEFVNMITVQSAYEASTKVISTAQQLFQALSQAKQ